MNTTEPKDLLAFYQAVRKHTEFITLPLEKEDYVVQPMPDVSPPKWHLGHTTWFFETFVLKPKQEGYNEFHAGFNFIFNSYYETVGTRIIRTDRGNLSRPTVDEVFSYRRHVDDAMALLLSGNFDPETSNLVVLGLNHEQQHQELLMTDIKYILGHNPLFPIYLADHRQLSQNIEKEQFVKMKEGIYEIGALKDGSFSFDNELGRHKVYLNDYMISTTLVTNAEYLEFIQSGGYKDFRHWHAEGWNWVNQHGAGMPLYWHNIDGDWYHYTYGGLQPLEPDQPLSHVNYYEATAYASWKGMRLPTEFEWEAAAEKFSWGMRWEWTQSAYLPYPGFGKAEGAIGEYNGKFMVGQQVLRGASEMTPPGHSRITYRNFFTPPTQWQLTGIRLAK